LSEDDRERARRLLLAAGAANLAGQYERTVTLTERAAELDLEPVVRSDLAALRGSAELWHGRAAETCDMLTAAARAVAPHDAGRALQLSGAAFMTGAIACDVERISRVAAVAASVSPDAGDERQVLLSLLPPAGELLFRGNIAASAPLFRRAARLSVGTDEPQDNVWRGLAALFSGDYAQAQEIFSTAAARARELGALGTLWYVLTAQALGNMYFAFTREAAEAAHEAARLSVDFGAEEHAASAVGVLAWVAAIQGDEEQHRRCAERVALDASRGIALPPATIAWGRAELALARGRWEEALEDLSDLSDYRPGFGHPLVAVASAPGLVEAAVRSGRLELTAAPLALLGEWVNHASPQHRQPLLERALALRAETPTDAAEHYEEALRLHEHGGSPFNRARTELLYGEHLRRERKRREARPHLRAALHGFERLGAAPWVTRAAVELRATGETARKRDPSTLGQLTPQELQIARLVGDGGSNKEIAAQLFLSPRTVEYHLRKIFMKLGIASRAELIRRDIGAELTAVS
jgi:ATP/maltotriose-dependent transcriptional regulator MalT